VAPTGKSVGTEARQEWHGEVETLVREWDEAHGLEIGPETNGRCGMGRGWTTTMR
jgi:hypothetical protein